MRAAFLVSGGTGSKTTLLSALLSIAPPSERILIVEDSGELTPDHEHVVRLEVRPPNVEGSGHVSMRRSGSSGAANASRQIGGW